MNTPPKSQIDVVSFRPDDQTKSKIRLHLRKKANKQNRSKFYLRVFRIGLDTIDQAV